MKTSEINAFLYANNIMNKQIDLINKNGRIYTFGKNCKALRLNDAMVAHTQSNGYNI